MICVFLVHYQSSMGLKSKVWGKQANKWIINAKQFPICRYLQNCQLLHKEAAHTSGAANPLALCWKCNSPRTGCAWRITPISVWHEQPIIEWLQRMISIVACCHSVKHLPLRLSDHNSCKLPKIWLCIGWTYTLQHSSKSLKLIYCDCSNQLKPPF